MKELTNKQMKSVDGGKTDDKQHIRYCKKDTNFEGTPINGLSEWIKGVLPKGTKVKVETYSSHKKTGKSPVDRDPERMRNLKVDGVQATCVEVMEGTYKGYHGIVAYTSISNQRTRPKD